MPHISLLAPAILSAMQGAPNSVSQGLRTLELSIDNMQNDFLYEQLEPVKKELMKALWNIMMTGNSQMQISALRFLGKISSHALKSIREPQQLHPRTMEDDLGPCLTLQMPVSYKPGRLLFECERLRYLPVTDIQECPGGATDTCLPKRSGKTTSMLEEGHGRHRDLRPALTNLEALLYRYSKNLFSF